MGHAGGKLRDGCDLLRAQEIVLEITVARDVLDHEDGAHVLVFIVFERKYPKPDEPLFSAVQLLPGVFLPGGDFFLDLGAAFQPAALKERFDGLVHQHLVLQGEDLHRREVDDGNPLFQIQDDHPDGKVPDDVLVVLLQEEQLPVVLFQLFTAQHERVAPTRPRARCGDASASYPADRCKSCSPGRSEIFLDRRPDRRRAAPSASVPLPSSAAATADQVHPALRRRQHVRARGVALIHNSCCPAPARSAAPLPPPPAPVVAGR